MSVPAPISRFVRAKHRAGRQRVDCYRQQDIPGRDKPFRECSLSEGYQMEEEGSGEWCDSVLSTQQNWVGNRRMIVLRDGGQIRGSSCGVSGGSPGQRSYQQVMTVDAKGKLVPVTDLAGDVKLERALSVVERLATTPSQLSAMAEHFAKRTPAGAAYRDPEIFSLPPVAHPD